MKAGRSFGHGRRNWVRRSLGLSVLAAAALVSSCEEERGPGTYEVSIESPSRVAGGAVAELRVVGLQDIVAVGDVDVFWTPIGQTGVVRVVVVARADRVPLRLQISVEDVATAEASGSVLEATSLANEPVTALGDFSVEFERNR